MENTVFETQLVEVNGLVIDAIEKHFARSGVKFDRARFLEATSIELDAITRGAFFFGAEVFPIEIPTKDSDNF